MKPLNKQKLVESLMVLAEAVEPSHDFPMHRDAIINHVEEMGHHVVGWTDAMLLEAYLEHAHGIIMQAADMRKLELTPTIYAETL